MATIDRTPQAANHRRQRAAHLRRGGYSNTRIAEEIGVDRSVVYRWLGPTPAELRVRWHSKETRDKAARLRKEGLNNARIAKKLGVGERTVWDWIGSTPTALRSNRDYSRTNLPDRALHLRQCGYSVREAAAHMGIPVSTVGQWVKGYGRYGLLD